MKNLLLLAWALGICLNASAKDSSEASLPKVGALELNKDYGPDTGCSIVDDKGVTIFIDQGLVEHPIMKIDGVKVSLKKEKSPKPFSYTAKEGSKLKAVYSFKKMRIVFDGSVSKGCPASNEACETTEYNATLTLTNGSGSKQIKGLKANCSL